MSTVAGLKEEIVTITTLGYMSSAFTEAAAIKLKNIKGMFQRNTRFYDEISYVYHLVKLSAKSRNLIAGMDKSGASILCVAVTSNQRFYGNLNRTVMQTFLADSMKYRADMLVLGSTGAEYMESSGVERPFARKIFEKEFPTPEEIKDFLDSVSVYETVFVYYPRFISLLTQTVGSLDITQAMNPDEIAIEEELRILYEPELIDILSFFERQVRGLLLLRILYETELSRTAARLISMSRAEDKAKEELRIKRAQLRKTVQSFINARQLEVFARAHTWNK